MGSLPFRSCCLTRNNPVLQVLKAALWQLRPWPPQSNVSAMISEGMKATLIWVTWWGALLLWTRPYPELHAGEYQPDPCNMMRICISKGQTISAQVSQLATVKPQKPLLPSYREWNHPSVQNEGTHFETFAAKHRLMEGQSWFRGMVQFSVAKWFPAPQTRGMEVRLKSVNIF